MRSEIQKQRRVRSWIVVLAIVVTLLTIGVFLGEDEIAPRTALEDEPSAVLAEMEEDAVFMEGPMNVENYVLHDIVVRKNSLGNFQVLATATNEGQDRSTVTLMAYLFDDETLVGSTRANINDWEQDETISIEMVSSDTHTEWDEIELGLEREL